MVAGIYAELSADGKEIVLAVTGSDHELDRAAKALRKLTMLTKPTDPPSGIRTAPATWATAVELAFTFNSDSVGRWLPQPRLKAWIEAEFWRRHRVTAYPADAAIPAGLTPRPYQYEAASMIGRIGKCLLLDDPGPQPMSARVLTPHGWTTMGAVRPGDEVMGADGFPHRVLATYDKGTRPVCKITFSDGATTWASEDHLWAVQTYQMRARVNDTHKNIGTRAAEDGSSATRGYRVSRGQRWLVRKTSELKSGGSLVNFIPVAAPAEFAKQDLPLHPYVLGALLGDGGLSHRIPKDGFVQFTTSHEEFAGLVGLYAEVRKRYGLQWGVRAGREIHALGLAGKRSGGKFIPDGYLRGSREQREDLLHGLMDSDGRVSVRPGRRTRLQWSTTSAAMRDQFTELVRSLGGTAHVMHADKRKANTCWTFSLELPPEVHPFRVSYKAGPAQSARTEPARAVRSVEPAGSERVKCLLVDVPDHLYITDDYVVTSNTGKTVSTLLGLKARQLTHEIFPLLIICPSWDICDVFQREIATWAPEWPQPVLYSGPGRTVNDKIMLTTYATATLDAADASGPLVKLRPKAVVCDEIHAIKNVKAKRTHAVTRIAARADTFVGLTGTPVVQDTGDIFPVLAALDPASWPSRERFVKRYCLTSQSDYAEIIDGLDPLREPEFRVVLQGQYRRVAKSDVLNQLPPKIYSIRQVDIPPVWRKAYDSMAEDMLAQLPDDGGELPVMSTLAQLTRLSQLASSACDVEMHVELDEYGEEVKKYEVSLRAPSWKAEALCGILAERKGQPVAVFAPSRQLIMVAGQVCEAAGYRCGYVTGQHTAAGRRTAIDGFQAGELDVILVTAGAGGQGITLTAAGTAVFLQRPWSLAESIQCEGRVHRIGSERHDAVEIIDVLAKKTIDTSVRAALRGKAASLAEMVQDPRIVRELLGGLG